LSPTHALFFDPAVVWNGVPTDVYTATVGPPASMKIKVWTYWGGASAAADVQFATGQFTKFKTGINLVSQGVSNPTLTGPTPTSLSCDDIPSLVSSSNFDKTAVNVYYAEGTSCTGYACEGLSGSSCADRRFIFVYSTAASSNVMLHEL